MIEDVTILLSVKTIGKDMTFDFLNWNSFSRKFSYIFLLLRNSSYMLYFSDTFLLLQFSALLLASPCSFPSFYFPAPPPSSFLLFTFPSLLFSSSFPLHFLTCFVFFSCLILVPFPFLVFFSYRTSFSCIITAYPLSPFSFSLYFTL